MRKSMIIVEQFLIETTSKYPPILADAHEIAEYISEVSGDYVDVEFIEENFRDCSAKLEMVPIASIIEGNGDHNIKSTKKERAYMKMSPETIPPLVIKNFEVMDGNHRLRVARKLGLTELPCYVVTEIN
jgi:hypothetical protein